MSLFNFLKFTTVTKFLVSLFQLSEAIFTIQNQKRICRNLWIGRPISTNRFDNSLFFSFFINFFSPFDEVKCSVHCRERACLLTSTQKHLEHKSCFNCYYRWRRTAWLNYKLMSFDFFHLWRIGFSCVPLMVVWE